MKKQGRVVVGISGGVDSAVSAYLLKQQGYQVIGITMQNWMPEHDDPHCQSEQDISDARAVCDQLQVPFHMVNFSKEYWDEVFQHCLDEFAAGRTPNPDIGCNQLIVKLWNEGLTANEISYRVGYKPKTIINKISSLRKIFGDDVVRRKRQ